MPHDPALSRALLLRWANGDAAGAQLLELVCEIARLADDIADGEADADAVPRLLHRCLVDLPANAFVQRHGATLRPVLSECVHSWALSNEWRRSGCERRQTFGFVYREATDRLGLAVAQITGGYDHARAVARDIFRTCHAPSTETVAAWANEG